MAGESHSEEIIDFTCAQLRLVQGIGAIYPYQLLMLTPESVTALLGTPGELHYWTVTIASTTETYNPGREVIVVHDLVLRGYHEVADVAVTEPAFRRVGRRARDFFRGTHQVGGIADAELYGPLQVTVSGEHRLLANTFYTHYFEGHLSAQERLFF